MTTTIEEAKRLYYVGDQGPNGSWHSMAAEIDKLIDKALASQASAHAAEIKALKERHSEILQTERLGWLEGQQKAVEEALAKQLEGHVRHIGAVRESAKQISRAAVEQERLRGEQALQMERRNWESYREGEAKRLRAREDELWKAWVTTCSDDKVEMALEAYKSGEKERIEKAVAEAYKNAAEVAWRHERECSTNAVALHQMPGEDRWAAKSILSEDIATEILDLAKAPRPPEAFVEAQKAVERPETIAELCNIPHGPIAAYDINYRFMCSIGQGVAPWIQSL